MLPAPPQHPASTALPSQSSLDECLIHHLGRQLWAMAKIQCLIILNIQDQIHHSHSCHEGSNTIVAWGQNPFLPFVRSHCSAHQSSIPVPPSLFVLCLPHPAAPGVSRVPLHSVCPLRVLFDYPFRTIPLFRVSNLNDLSTSSHLP